MSQPIAIVSWPMNCDAREFVAHLGHRISHVSGDDKRQHFFVLTYFCFAIAVQFYLLHNSFEVDDCPEH